MKLLSWPYGTLLEFDSLAQHYGLDKGLAEYYQSKWWSFYIVLHPQWRQLLARIAQEYIDAGVDVVITPTYRGWNHFLRDADDVMLCNHWTQIIASGIVHLARSSDRSVWWSIGPIGDSYTAVGSPHTLWLAYEKHIGHIQALQKAGVDALLFETAVKFEEIKGVMKCAEEVGLPLYISFYVNEHGQIPEPNAARSLDAMIADLQLFAKELDIQVSYGINCAQKKSILKALAENTLAKQYISFIYPNASHPTATSYTTCVHDETDGSLQDFFQQVAQLWYSVQYWWGCCGYIPSDIKKLSTGI